MKQDNVSKEFAGLVGDAWHKVTRDEPEDYYSEILKQNCIAYKCTCGEIFAYSEDDITVAAITECVEPNPAYTIELIKERIQAQGDWDGFVTWHYDEIYMTCIMTFDFRLEVWIKNQASADILTTPALLMQAYIAYRRQADKCNGWCRTSKGPLEDMMSLHGAEMGLNVIDKTCREEIK